MKSYPSIPHYDKEFIGRKIWAFDKLDGSNIRFEYSRKRGWYKFGTRKEMIDENTPIYGKAVTIFLDKYSDDLARIFRKEYSNIQSFIVFGEFVGENSFAGQHNFDDKMDVVMFDINIYKKGLIHPRDFIDKFSSLHIPDVIYVGDYDEDLINNVTNNIWGLKEGVICKGALKRKGNDEIWMTKLKTKKWLLDVKNKYGIFAIKEEFNGKMPLIY